MLSRTGAIARRIRALRSDAKLRAHDEVIIAEGIHLAFEALAASARIELAIVSPRLTENQEGIELSHRLRGAGVLVHMAAESTLLSLADSRSPQPVLLLVRRRLATLDEAIAGRGGDALFVAACGVQDPGNVGALLRTSDAAGATGFAASETSASLTHPRAVRAGMGSIFRLPAAEATLREILGNVKSSGFRVIGAAAKGGKAYDAVDWSGPVALLLGGEGAGLPPDAGAALDVRVSIPMAPPVESLSVGAAAAVLLFQAARVRGGVSRAG